MGKLRDTERGAVGTRAERPVAEGEGEVRGWGGIPFHLPCMLEVVKKHTGDVWHCDLFLYREETNFI